MNVEQDILMDEMNEWENERVERILSNDYLIIENVLYGISRRNSIIDIFINAISLIKISRMSLLIFYKLVL
jgi:hypothetical protein